MAPLSVWYVSNLQRCNFSCGYCASGQPVRQRDKRLPTWSVGADVHERVVDWLTRQPHAIRLRMNSIGEPFVDRSYLQSVARLTRAENLSWVEILTNGSYRPAQFDQFVAECDPSKLSLWMTFHHQFIAPSELVAAAAHARSHGVSVIVNALLFPDNLDAVEALVGLCDEREIPIATGFGLNFNEAYAGQGFTPATRAADARALALGDRNNALGADHAHAAAPAGKPCAAGGSYFYVHSNGDVFPCRTYAQARQSTRLGSALDEGFTLQPRTERFRACSAPGRCGCPEDYQNLEAIQSRFTWPSRSFGLPVLNNQASA
jgi:MoaA/NifB/PqqE/SkfB family radical SAM enzyme